MGYVAGKGKKHTFNLAEKMCIRDSLRPHVALGTTAGSTDLENAEKD